VKRYILAHDLGTSSDKAALFGGRGEVVGSASAPYGVLMPQPGWAEQDPEAWWAAVCRTTREALARSGATPAEVTAVSFSGQMQGTLPVDAAGRPLMHCMIWMDGRAHAQARQLTTGRIRAFGYGAFRLARWIWLASGAPSLTGTDAISKIVWLRESRPELWDRTHKLLDAKDYLLFRCTGRYVTSYDCGNLTWLMDTRKGRLRWSEALLGSACIPVHLLPELVPSTEIVGGLTAEAAGDLGLLPGTPVVAGAGDAPAMAIGAGAVREREFHLALGTGAWIATHVEHRLVDPLSYVASMCSAHPRKYVVMASQQAAGICVEWARTHLLRVDGQPATYDELDDLAERSEAGAGGLFFLPWMIGERTPIDDRHARAGFVNLGLDHHAPHLARAVYEGIALNARWALEKVERLVGGRGPGIRFAGGCARSDVWCRLLADVLDRPILQVADPELAAARGAALLAAHALGTLPDFESIPSLVPLRASYEPRPASRRRYDEAFGAFRDYYRRNRGWFARVNAGH
jgi:xylulokinase